MIIAIFIIVIIGLLGSSLMTLQRDAAKEMTYDAYAVRADFAAYSANEVAMATIFSSDPNAIGRDKLSTERCLNNKKITVQLPKDSVGFHDCEDVSYTCNSTRSEAGTIYTITSKAICQNSEIKVYREKVTKRLAD